MKNRLKNAKKETHTLQWQITLIFIAVILGSIALVAMLNGFFLEKYYIAEKTNVLMQAKEQIAELPLNSLMEEGFDESYEFYFGEEGEGFDDTPYMDDIEPEEDADARSEAAALDEIGRYSSRNNLSWVVINAENSSYYSWAENDKVMRGKLFGYIYQLDSSESSVIKETKDCLVQEVFDRFAGMSYVECWGWIDEDLAFLIRTPLESIHESAQISNRFYIFTGLIVTVISAIFLAFLMQRLMKPIRELTELSQRMASLDFRERYKSSAGNEIDVLGESFNKMSDELERTVSELKTANLELQRDIEDKIEIDRRRKEFLDNVSHELKTPIALIQGYAEGLKDNISDDPESREFYCDVIIDESQKMNTLVKSLLTLDQLESGNDQFVMERFDIVQMIRGILQNMDILLQQCGAEVVFDQDEPVFVWADEFKMEEVVTNYISNAIHHLGGENQIVIKLEQETDKVRVSVFNTGNPIPEEDIPNLWEKFYKVDKARTREYGGSGIGLSIVKAVMEGMNQEYGVKNYDNGVEFWFTLDRK